MDDAKLKKVIDAYIKQIRQINQHSTWNDAVIAISKEKTPPAGPEVPEVNEWGVVSP